MSIRTILIFGILFLTFAACQSEPKDKQDPSKKIITDAAIKYYSEAKVSAMVKGIIKNDEEIPSDSLWMKLLIEYPDSALDYAKNLKSKVESGFLKKWPSLLSNQNQAFIDSQSMIAFGAMKFNMTEEEVSKLPYGETKIMQSIGGYNYFISPRYDDNGKLYMIQIETNNESANYIDTDLKNKAMVLRDVISEKYDDYENALYKYPSIIDMKTGTINFFNSWKIGSKHIKLGLGEASTGSEYYVHCRIYNEELFNEQMARVESENNKIKRVDASKF